MNNNELFVIVLTGALSGHVLAKLIEAALFEFNRRSSKRRLDDIILRKHRTAIISYLEFAYRRFNPNLDGFLHVEDDTESQIRIDGKVVCAKLAANQIQLPNFFITPVLPENERRDFCRIEDIPDELLECLDRFHALDGSSQRFAEQLASSSFKCLPPERQALALETIFFIWADMYRIGKMSVYLVDNYLKEKKLGRNGYRALRALHLEQRRSGYFNSK